MKNLRELFRSIYILIPLFILTSCNIERNHGLPELETLTVIDITLTSAKSGGNITSDGRADITAKGICWGINANPTVSESHTSDRSGDVVFCISPLNGWINNLQRD